MRDDIRISIYDMIANKSSNKSIFNKIRSINAKIFVLQSNIFGLGINFNEIIKPNE